ncbi:hypothetical protein [Flavisphingomonas formosensis]|uniref:hypothetical protein n=1 Tax=Flavisphingomonas formosensis TaxID=861534 RepID=UPI0012F9FC29|nr:hypothetical protein [Sphingomonas formosensis]
MSIAIRDGVIMIAGHCPVEEAEMLLVALLENPGSGVDLSAATRLHMAVAQLLAAAKPPVVAAPRDAFLRDMLLPALFHLDQ